MWSLKLAFCCATVLSHWLPVYVGKISYPLYLWHWPVICAIKWVQGDGRCGGRWNGWFYKTEAVVVSVVAAAFTYHCVEGAARAWRPKKPSSIFAVFLVMPSSGMPGCPIGFRAHTTSAAFRSA